jgi:AraC-like DNA-binding protein
MHAGVVSLLERHPHFHTRDVDEAHAFAEQIQYRFEFGRRPPAQIDLRANGVYLPSGYIGYIQYGPEVRVVTPAARLDHYWLQLPVRGNFEITNSAGSVACAPGRGAVSGPTAHVNRSQAGSARLNLAITRGSMERQLAALLGDAPGKTLEFAPEVDFTAGYGRSLAGYLWTAVSDLDSDGSVLRRPLTISAFEQFIMTAMLLSHPNSYSTALRRLATPVAPRDVRRALDYIEAHLDTGFTIGDLVAATGVAGRTLFKHFRDFKGMSPMRYARNARFRQVRQALLRAEPEESVTDIAMSRGFVHMGRFSIEYRRLFGESPSRTLGRRWRRP